MTEVAKSTRQLTFQKALAEIDKHVEAKDGEPALKKRRYALAR